jgi:hypothetical protein
MNKIKAALACAGILLTLASAGQNRNQALPVGTLPMLYNGGFAGEGKNARFTIGGSRLTTPPTYGYFGSYDQFITKLSTGIGITFAHDNHTSKDIYLSHHYRNYLVISISPKISIRGKFTFAPFIDYTHVREETQYFDPSFNYSYPAHFRGGRVTNFRTGLLFNSREFYVGLTLYIPSKTTHPQLYPSDNLVGSPVVLQAGYTFQKLPESDLSITPQAAIFFVREGGAVQGLNFDSDRSVQLRANLNLLVRYKKVIASINNVSGMSVGLGMQTKKFRVLLNQNYTYYIFHSGKETERAASLSLRYTLK